jgi:hypothetical protein
MIRTIAAELATNASGLSNASAEVCPLDAFDCSIRSNRPANFSAARPIPTLMARSHPHREPAFHLSIVSRTEVDDSTPISGPFGGRFSPTRF